MAACSREGFQSFSLTVQDAERTFHCHGPDEDWITQDSKRFAKVQLRQPDSALA